MGLGVLWWLVQKHQVSLPLLIEPLRNLFHYRPVSGRYLLYTLPLGAAVVVFARMIIGMKSFGLFTPMLMAMVFLQTGPLIGPLILAMAIGSGLVLAPLLKHLKLARVGFLAVLMSIVSVVLIAVSESLTGPHWATAFPVVVTALSVERWWVTWEGEGIWEAVKTSGNTLLLAVVIEALVLSEPVFHLVAISPFMGPVVGGAIALGCGMYRGLRLNELRRFQIVQTKPA